MDSEFSEDSELRKTFKLIKCPHLPGTICPDLEAGPQARPPRRPRRTWARPGWTRCSNSALRCACEAWSAVNLPQMDPGSREHCSRECQLPALPVGGHQREDREPGVGRKQVHRDRRD